MACDKEINWPKEEPEMTEFESAFLCGLIKERKPRKIVEVGVAAGGTTTIMLKCLEFLGFASQTEFFSIDISEPFYRNSAKKSGFLAEEYLKRSQVSFNHRFLLGRILPEVLGEIGDGIDFVVLDTAHLMPAEILDFLALFPYLSKDACVVLHDIAFNHLFSGDPLGFSTQLIFSCVKADKIIKQDTEKPTKYPNIGAFVINEFTKDSLFDILNVLMITWKYILPETQFKSYYACYLQSYGKDFADMFALIYDTQKKTKEIPAWKKIAYDVITNTKRFLLPNR